MIDDKKIEEAAERQLDYLGSYGLNEDEIGKIGTMVLYREEDVKESFKAAINWFLDNLWHPASEKPKKVKNLLLETTYEYGKPIYHLIKYMPNGNNVCAWREWYKGAHISRWLYIDDLLPKEGGNQ